MRTLIPLALTAASACFGAPESHVSTEDSASEAPPRYEVEIVDRRGRRYPDEAPTWPLIRVRASHPLVDPAAAALVRGLTFEALVDDLSSAPLRARTRDAIVPTRLTVDDRGLILEPTQHLARGEDVFVGVGAWALEVEAPPFVAQISVSRDPTLGAWPVETWPADATHGVPFDAPFVAVRFDGAVDLADGDLRLTGPAGDAPGRTEVVPCETIGWTEGTCATLTLDAALARGSLHRVRLADGLTDRTGAPLGPLTAEVTTASARPPAAYFVAAPCTADERPVGPLCVFVDDRRIVARLTASAPARFFGRAAGQRRSAVAPRGAATLAFDGLHPEEEVVLTFWLIDLAGNEERGALRIVTTPSLPEVGIVEVRSDPEGPEPAQEYVELLNSGPMPIDLAGYSLADREDRAGDVIGRASVVPAGGRALLVADAFDPRHPEDPRVPDGVPLVRVGTSLGSGGLSNAGEPLFLRDPLGRRLSAAPGVSTGSGRCLARTSPAIRRGDRDAFAVGGCSPGRPP